MNDLLAICIPTYNRAEYLDKNLSILIDTVRDFEIPVYINDNASSDSTPEVVARYQKEYEYIFYNRNPENIGACPNFEVVLKKASAKYRWLLGDDDSIADKEDLAFVLECLEKNRPDALVCGWVGPRKTVEFTDKKLILYNLSREMTWMSINVFSEAIVREGEFSKYVDANFVHLGVILDWLFTHNGRLLYCYLPDIIRLHVGDETVSFYSESTRDWSRGYAEIILRLPELDYRTKLEYLHHTCETGELNSLVRLASYRSWGGFSVKSLKENLTYIRLFNYKPYVLLWLVAVFPKTPLRLLRTFLRSRGATTVTKWIE